MASIAPASARPFLVSEYSTRTGVSGTTAPIEDPLLLELLKALAEHPVGDLGDRRAQGGEAAARLEQEKDDRAGPSASDQLARAMEARAQLRRVGGGVAHAASA